jgi:hypothetical protein
MSAGHGFTGVEVFGLKLSPSVARANLAFQRDVAGLAFSAARVFGTSPKGATAMWILSR